MCGYVFPCVCVSEGDQEETLKPSGWFRRHIMPKGKRQGSTVIIINSELVFIFLKLIYGSLCWLQLSSYRGLSDQKMFAVKFS